MVRNKRIKRLSNFAKAIGPGLVAIAVLRPVLETGGDPCPVLFWSLAGVALHGVAHYALGYLR